ncbi:MAG: molybdenum ABC transporter ATP-binding protein [Proteobacteria bacterium]|nr:molybdenum ABC transporter ATP-binding protein [Pseudomonadota bacterium]
MSISVAIRHQLGRFALDVSFESRGRLTALFGPSGCGKTSVINIIAGLIRADVARITIRGDVLADTAQGLWLPAHRRRIGYVFQDSRLFPHLSVRQNLGYGRWFTPKPGRYADEASVVDMLGLAKLLERKPQQLSGGEKQRVALGRALLQSPRLLLMDEPLASLDEARKLDVMPYIERLRDELKIPIIYVSHSPAEVARLATDVVLMAEGRVLRSGAAGDVLPAIASAGDDYSREAGSLLEMRVAGHDPETGLTTLQFAGGVAFVTGPVAARNTQVRVLVRATDVMLATVRPKGISALNILGGKVESIVEDGASADAVLRVGDARLTARLTRHSVQQLGLKPGKTAYAIVKAMSVKTPTRLPSVADAQGADARP